MGPRDLDLPRMRTKGPLCSKETSMRKNTANTTFSPCAFLCTFLSVNGDVPVRSQPIIAKRKTVDGWRPNRQKEPFRPGSQSGLYDFSGSVHSCCPQRAGQRLLSCLATQRFSRAPKRTRHHYCPLPLIGRTTLPPVGCDPTRHRHLDGAHHRDTPRGDDCDAGNHRSPGDTRSLPLSRPLPHKRPCAAASHKRSSPSIKRPRYAPLALVDNNTMEKEEQQRERSVQISPSVGARPVPASPARPTPTQPTQQPKPAPTPRSVIVPTGTSKPAIRPTSARPAAIHPKPSIVPVSAAPRASIVPTTATPRTLAAPVVRPPAVAVASKSTTTATTVQPPSTRQPHTTIATPSRPGATAPNALDETKTRVAPPAVTRPSAQTTHATASKSRQDGISTTAAAIPLLAGRAPLAQSPGDQVTPPLSPSLALSHKTTVTAGDHAQSHRTAEAALTPPAPTLDVPTASDGYNFAAHQAHTDVLADSGPEVSDQVGAGINGTAHTMPIACVVASAPPETVPNDEADTLLAKFIAQKACGIDDTGAATTALSSPSENNGQPEGDRDCSAPIHLDRADCAQKSDHHSGDDAHTGMRTVGDKDIGVTNATLAHAHALSHLDEPSAPETDTDAMISGDGDNNHRQWNTHLKLFDGDGGEAHNNDNVDVNDENDDEGDVGVMASGDGQSHHCDGHRTKRQRMTGGDDSVQLDATHHPGSTLARNLPPPSFPSPYGGDPAPEPDDDNHDGGTDRRDNRLHSPGQKPLTSLLCKHEGQREKTDDAHKGNDAHPSSASDLCRQKTYAPHVGTAASLCIVYSPPPLDEHRANHRRQIGAPHIQVSPCGRVIDRPVARETVLMGPWSLPPQADIESSAGGGDGNPTRTAVRFWLTRPVESVRVIGAPCEFCLAIGGALIEPHSRNGLLEMGDVCDTECRPSRMPPGVAGDRLNRALCSVRRARVHGQAVAPGVLDLSGIETALVFRGPLDRDTLDRMVVRFATYNVWRECRSADGKTITDGRWLYGS